MNEEGTKEVVLEELSGEEAKKFIKEHEAKKE